MEASDIKSLKDLKGENRRLKQMYADLSLGNKILKTLLKSSEASRASLASGISVC